MDFYKALNIEKLRDDPGLMKKLEECALSDPVFVIPGYQYDYYLYKFRLSGIEFEICRNLQGDVVGIEPHYTADFIQNMVFLNILNESASAHVYRMKTVESLEELPVRIMCPDVLAYPRRGDLIRGQIVAAIEPGTLKAESSGRLCIRELEDGACIEMSCLVEKLKVHTFRFEDVSTEFLELTVNTSAGRMTAVALKDGNDPEVGNYYRCKCMISFDVAMVPEAFCDQTYEKDVYKKIFLNGDSVEYRNGLVPNARNTERVFEYCLEKSDYSRMLRCCSATVKFCQNGNQEDISNHVFVKKMTALHIVPCEENRFVHCLNSDASDLLGCNVITAGRLDGDKICIAFFYNNCGVIEKVFVTEACRCSCGFDHELHAVSVLADSMCNDHINQIKEILAEKCWYRSDYADVTNFGAQKIVERLARINKNLTDESRYTYRILPVKDVLRTDKSLPAGYQVNWCFEEYQRGDLAAVVFIHLDDNAKIDRILLSRDGNYLKKFEKERSFYAIRDKVVVPGVRSILEQAYSSTDTLSDMRASGLPENDENGIYVWKKADEKIRQWLRDIGYVILDSELEEDCIGYACRHRGLEFAIYVYAYGKQKSVNIDVEYCQRLRTYSLSENRTILIAYLEVKETALTENGNSKEYLVGRYNAPDQDIELWRLDRVDDKNILLFYPRREVFEMVPRFMAAFNTQNLDLLKAFCSKDVEMSDGGGCFLNDGFYSYLSSLYHEYGKMKTAYVRYNDVLYSKTPYLENKGYISFSMNSMNRINHISLEDLDEGYRDLYISEECPVSCPLNEYPKPTKVELTAPSEIARFSAMVTFSSGEIKKYIIDGDFGSDDVVKIDGVTFTDKIFRNGRIAEHIDKPKWPGYRDYPERGQGIQFINGYVISAAEIYFNGYPADEFDYLPYEERIEYRQGDSASDFGIGLIRDVDPENPLYLFNKKTHIARKIPDKYKNTPFYIYPFCGGYSEGRVMVSLLGNIDLQCFHESGGEPGIWGWLDEDLKEVIEPQYIYALNFEDGQAVVCKGAWTIQEKDGKNKYWCDHEQWGVIDTEGRETVPCIFDEVYRIDGTARLFLTHRGGWKEGNYCIYDTQEKAIILEMDFDFDSGYMFNKCFVADNSVLVFLDHQSGEELDYIYAYDLYEKKYIAYKEEYKERTLNGKTKVVVNKAGNDIIIF